MMKVQFEALSATLSRAIRPLARKQEVTAIFPKQVEPLWVLREEIESELPPARPQDPEKLETGVNSRPVSVPDQCQIETQYI